MTISRELFTRAQKVIPGGVNSPVRAFRGVGGEPPFIDHANGAYLYDVDGKQYVDYVGSWGPMIVGHNHPYVVERVLEAIHRGVSFGAPCGLEVALAEKVVSILSFIDQVRFVNSGTEATMSAIRLARGFTGRRKILKFSGCYHGHSDSLLVAAGSGALTLGVPSSKGVPEALAEQTLIANYNDLPQVEALFSRFGEDIACIMVEPVAGNMNCILPQPDFLPGLKRLCENYGALLIFDEVMTGFRVALGGAAQYYNITPDLITLGKIIGGGFPVGAFGGRGDVMAHIAPLGPVYQAGTLSGNPVAMAAGLATLELLQTPDFYKNITETTEALIDGLVREADEHGIPLFAQSIGAMFGLFFTEATTITREIDAKQCDIEAFKQFYHGMLAHGVYLAPSAFEAGFVSSAHGEEELALTFHAAKKVFASMTEQAIERAG